MLFVDTILGAPPDAIKAAPLGNVALHALLAQSVRFSSRNFSAVDLSP